MRWVTLQGPGVNVNNLSECSEKEWFDLEDKVTISCKERGFWKGSRGIIAQNVRYD